MSINQQNELKRLLAKESLNKYEAAMVHYLQKKQQLEELDKEFKIIYE